MQDTICPICHNALKEGETLTIEFFAPRNWWVLLHERNVIELFTSETEQDEFGYPEQIRKSRGWCARANVSIDGIPIRGSDQIGF